MTSTAASTSSLQFSSLLGSTIESIVHELLYSRSIYPTESFVLHRHLGVRCHANRVPQVCDYVSNFLRTAIPSVMAGIADGLDLVILEELTNGSGRRGVGERNGSIKVVERFVFRFQIDTVVGSAMDEEARLSRSVLKSSTTDIEDLRQCALGRDTELAIEARSSMERSMRECLLRVLALRRRRRGGGEKAENMSFKLCLHVASSAQQDTCPELMRALHRGEWLMPEESSCLFSDLRKGLLRPIKDVHLPKCGLQMQLGMEVDPNH